MATAAQIEANRANAQKSTGPRTAEGKDRACQNALKHGLFAREGVLRGEDEDEFETHRERLLGQLNPIGPLEEILAARVVDLSWRLQRAAQDREEAFVALYERQTAGTDAASGTGLPAATRSGQALSVNPEQGQDGDAKPEGSGGGTPAPAAAATLGRMILEDFSHDAVLERLLRYERRIENSLYRTLNQLRRIHDQIQKADREDADTLARWREEDWKARKARSFACYPPVEASPEPVGTTTNTPVPDGAGWDRATGEDAGQSRKNKPNVRQDKLGKEDVTKTDSSAGPLAGSGGPEGPDYRRSRRQLGANLPREEPDAGNPHVRVCEGRGGQSPRLLDLEEEFPV